jgi:hypothetical protein
MRENIFSRITVRNSIVTENDYELLFKYQDTKPFVDAKFMDATAFVFLFNVLRNNDEVIPSTSVNMRESDLMENSFYPELDYAGHKLISPFYYKNVNMNRIDAYMVDPSVPISLRGDLRSPNASTLADYRVEVAITYNFEKNASYIEIISGAQEDLEYYFISDDFVVNLTSSTNDNAAPFTYQISTLFTDSYCILRKPLKGISLHVRNPQGQVLASYIADGEYDQITKKQTFYKYFQEVETPSEISELTPDVISYADNHRSDVMSTLGDITTGNDYHTEKYILRLPFISKDYFDSKSAEEMHGIMDSFFIANYTEEFIPYNALVTQAFHNTIDLPPKYVDSIFEDNTMETITSPKMPIEIEIFIDQNAFLSSKYGNKTDLEIAIRIQTIIFLKQKEGFIIDFFETDLENHLFNYFSPLIKNITVLSPTFFRTNGSQMIYNSIQSELDFQDVLDFIPPFFHYDYNNMKINVGW